MNVAWVDTETGSADEMAVDPSFIRLAAYAINDEPVTVTTNIAELVEVIRSADLVVCHNGIAFDLTALSLWHGLDVAKLVNEGRVRDTLIMARQDYPPAAPGSPSGYSLDNLAKFFGVVGKTEIDGESALKALAREFGGFDKIPVDHPDYVEYARRDVEVLREVAKRLTCDAYCIREMRYLWRLTAITRHGARVDMDEIAWQQDDVARRAREALTELHDRYGTPEPDSSKSPLATAAGKARLTEVLESFGVELEYSKTGAKVGKNDLDRYAESMPDNEELVRFCTLVKTANGLRQPPVKYVRSDGKFHPNVSAEQKTGRLSVTSPGLTVLGKRERKDARDRAVLLPDNDDEVILCVDLSQVDARALAAVTQDAAYMDAFEPGKDQHEEMAVRIFGDRSRRSDAKMFTHAINYNMGARSLTAKSGLDFSEVVALLGKLDQEFPDLKRVRDHMIETATGVIETPFGRRVGYDVHNAYTKVFASMGQGTARDLLSEGILRLSPETAERIRAIVHDEIVLSVPRDRFEEFRDEVLAALQFNFMARPGDRPVPILAAASEPGRDWADAYASEHPDWPEMSREWREANKVVVVA